MINTEVGDWKESKLPNLKEFPFGRPSPSSSSFCWTKEKKFEQLYVIHLLKLCDDDQVDDNGNGNDQDDDPVDENGNNNDQDDVEPARRSCVRLNARRSRDRLRNCSMISCQTPTYVFLNQDVWIFAPPPPPGHVFHKEERDKGVSSWYSWGCPATWVEALHQAVVRPLMADVEGRCDRAAVRILAAWVEDLLVWTKVQVDNWTSGQKIS